MNQGRPVPQLPDFLEYLERSGFEVTLQSRLAVHDLMVRLCVEGRATGDDNLMRRMIGPILCTSPSDQQQFESLLIQWQNRAESEPDDQHVWSDQSHSCQTYRKRRPPATALAVILLGMLGVAALAIAIRPHADSYRELASRFHRSISESTIGTGKSQGVETESDPQTVPTNDSVDPAASAQPDGQVSHRPADALVQQEASSLEENASATSEVEARENKRNGTTEQNSNTKVAQSAQRGLPRYAVAARITAVVFALFCLVAYVWWAVWARWRSRYLVKRSVSWQPEIQQIGVQLNASSSDPGNSLIRTAQRLRRHLSRSSHRLDMKQTANRTAAKGGLFTPVQAQQKRSPSYLMLIENDGRDDQQTQMIDSLVDRLESEDVAVTRYYFRRDPRICRPRSGPARRLAELASNHDRDRLLVFADAKSFLDPMTGHVAPWVESFAAWDERALLVSVEEENWSAAESTMARHFRLAAANQDGLSSLVHNFSPDPSLTTPIGDDLYPIVLREHPEQWLDREPPTEESLDLLIDQLRTYLGDPGYEWLSCCAVYPTLHHHMTLWAGQAITDDEGRSLINDSDLMRLSRLPWMRHGHLPDWLRARLISDLSNERESQIRTRLDGLFNSALKSSGAKTVLPIARETAGQLEKRRQGRVLRDHTFVSFMSNPLSVRLPRALSGILPASRYTRPKKTLAAAVALVVIYAACLLVLPWDSHPKLFQHETFSAAFHPSSLSDSSQSDLNPFRQRLAQNVIAGNADGDHLPQAILDDSASRFRALLVGCWDYQRDDIPDVPGAKNDVGLMRETLIKRFGFADESIVVLSNPSRNALLAAMDKLAEANDAEDAQIVVYFSGHGGKQIDGSGDEKDRLDEVFCPSSAAFRSDEGITLGGISDDEIDDFLVRAAQHAAVWMIADFSFYDGPSVSSTPHPITVFCAAPNQHRSDSNINRVPHGTFTFVLCSRLSWADPPLSYGQLMGQLANDPEIDVDTKPQMVASDPDLAVLGGNLEVRDDPGRTDQRRWINEVTSIHESALQISEKSGAAAAIMKEQRALDLSIEKLGQYHELTNGIRLSLAQLYETDQDYRKAKALYEQTLEMVIDRRGPDHADASKVLVLLSHLHHQMGDYEEAVMGYWRAYEILRAEVGERHVDTLGALLGLAAAHAEMGELGTAQKLFAAALEVSETVHGKSHPETAVVCHRLARVLDVQGDEREAETLYLRALEIRGNVLGGDHPDVAHCLHDLAVMHGRGGDVEAARKLLEQALQIRTAALGAKHHQTIDSRNALSELPEPVYGQSIEVPQQMVPQSIAETYPIGLEQMQAVPEQRQIPQEQRQAIPEQFQTLSEKQQTYSESTQATRGDRSENRRR